MQIAPATYKKMPLKAQFDHMAADYRRGNAAHKAAGKRRVDVIPAVLLDTGARAGLTVEEMRKAIEVSNGTLWRALKNAGIRLPKKSSAERLLLKAAALKPAHSEEEDGEDEAIVPSPTPRLPDAAGIVSAWLAESTDDAGTVSRNQKSAVFAKPVEVVRGGSSHRMKTPQLAEEVARRIVGEASDSLIAGTYTGRDGIERCDGLIGKGPEARPTIFAWRDKAREVEEILRLCRDIQNWAAATPGERQIGHGGTRC